MTSPTVSLALSPEAVEAIAQRVAAILAERFPAISNFSPYMTVAEAADYLRAKPQRVYDLLSGRRLTRHKDGTRVLISRAELEAHLTRTRYQTRD